MELNWWSEEKIFLFVQQEVNYCRNNCAQINNCLETRFQSELLFNTRMASCVSAGKMEGVCIRLNDAASAVTPVKNVLVVTDGWGNGTDARKDGQMNDRTVEGDSLS